MSNAAPNSTARNRNRGLAAFRKAGIPAVVIGLTLLFQAGFSHATIVGPYVPDAETLHLWHMNEQAVPVIDVGSDGTHLNALRNGATLGNESYKGFGTALSTYDGGPGANTDAGRDAYLSVRPLVNGPGDNVNMRYAGPSGAFTFEAIIRIDFDPQTNFGTNAAGTGRGTFMQIINLDADEGTNRVCQFRLVPIGLVKDKNQPLLEFINLNRDKSPQSLTAPIPTDGPDAIAFNGWYHVAVVYSGEPNQPGNLKLYWTGLDPSRTAANLIGSGQMQKSLPPGCAPDFAIGQTGRQSPVTPYPNNNFVGLIDEVRLSSVARPPSQMMFGGEVIVAVSPAPSASAPPAPAIVEPIPAARAPELRVADTGGTARGASSSAAWLIAGALVIIVGILGWLAFSFRRLVSKTVAAGQSPVRGINGHAHPQTNPAPNGFHHPQPRPVVPAIQETRSSEVSAEAESDEPSITVRKTDSGTEFIIRTREMPRETEPQSYKTGDQDFGLPKERSGGGPEVGFRGILRKVGLQDIIQLECLNRKSSILEIRNDNTKGRIYIDQGEIIHATFGSLSGGEAFHKLLSLQGGEFSLKTFEAPPNRTLGGPWIQLLMEAAKGRDEDAHGAEEKKISFKESSTTRADDILTIATVLSDHPQVKEILVCSDEGEALYSSRCQDPAGRQAVCSCLSRTAKNISQLLPMGDFQNLEILKPESKTIVQTELGCHLLIGLADE